MRATQVGRRQNLAMSRREGRWVRRASTSTTTRQPVYTRSGVTRSACTRFYVWSAKILPVSYDLCRQASQVQIYLPFFNPIYHNSVLIVNRFLIAKRLVGAFDKEKALVGAFSGHCSLIALLLDMTIITRWPEPAANNVPLETVQVHLWSDAKQPEYMFNLHDIGGFRGVLASLSIHLRHE